MTIKEIESKTGYKKIIEVSDIPIRFYWNQNGNFDGIEFGPFKNKIGKKEEELYLECLESVQPAIGSS